MRVCASGALCLIALVVVLLYIHLFGVGDVLSKVRLMLYIQQSHLIHLHMFQSISMCVLKK